MFSVLLTAALLPVGGALGVGKRGECDVVVVASPLADEGVEGVLQGLLLGTSEGRSLLVSWSLCAVLTSILLSAILRVLVSGPVRVRRMVISAVSVPGCLEVVIQSLGDDLLVATMREVIIGPGTV